MRCREYSTTPFLREYPSKADYCFKRESDARTTFMRRVISRQMIFPQRLCSFHPRSPSICHSDSDLSDSSRKYSPSSEASVETQRACGKKKHYHQTWQFAHTLRKTTWQEGASLARSPRRSLCSDSSPKNRKLIN